MILTTFIKAELNLHAFHPRFWSPTALRPDMTAATFEAIDATQLKAAGIEALIIDYDGVVVPYHSYVKPEASKLAKLRELQKDFIVAILSNRRGKLLESLKETFPGIPVLQSKRMKPHFEPYTKAVLHFDRPSHKIAIVEDRLVTGIAGAKKLGIYTIWITPALNHTDEPLNVRVYRWLEESVLRTYGA